MWLQLHFPVLGANEVNNVTQIRNNGQNSLLVGGEFPQPKVRVCLRQMGDVELTRRFPPPDEVIELVKKLFRGIHNAGTTCFINVWLQCLASSQHVRSVLEANLELRDAKGVLHKNDELGMFYKKIRTVVTELTKEDSILEPLSLEPDFLEYAYMLVGQQSGYADVFDLIMKMLNETVKDEPQVGFKGSPLSQLFLYKKGEHDTRVHVMLTTDQDSSKFYLSQSLAKEKFITLPKCLLIQIQKPTREYHEVRNDVEVMFPTTLTLKTVQERTNTYNLIGVINFEGGRSHKGGAKSNNIFDKKPYFSKSFIDTPYRDDDGHYTVACCREGVWAFCNDAEVSPLGTFLTNRAYCLFYEIIQ